MSEKYYSVEQISEMLQMHPKTIQRYIREGKLKAAKVGKGWRVTGHDLSVFFEGNGDAVEKASTRSNLGPSEERIKISAVLDVEVLDMDEAMRIVNSMTAVLNTKPPEYGRSTMNAQFLESEQKVRIMLWGNAKFIETMISSVSMLVTQETGQEV